MKRLLLLILLAPLAGVGFANADDGAKEDAESDSPPIPMEQRHMIEVKGRFYPVFEYLKEVEPEHDPKPRLPRKAKKEARGGTVLLGVLVAPDGTVSDTAVAMSNAESDIEKAAKEAVSRWLFPVQYHESAAIAYAVMVPVRFDATPHFGPQ